MLTLYCFNRYVYGSCASCNVIPIQRDGNCLFRVISYCMYNTEDSYYEARKSTVNKIINEWKYYKDFIVDLSIVNSTEDYKKITL